MIMHVMRRIQVSICKREWITKIQKRNEKQTISKTKRTEENSHKINNNKVKKKEKQHWTMRLEKKQFYACSFLQAVCKEIKHSLQLIGIVSHSPSKSQVDWRCLLFIFVREEEKKTIDFSLAYAFIFPLFFFSFVLILLAICITLFASTD